MLTLYTAAILVFASLDVPTSPTPLLSQHSSLAFADARSERRFHEYRARLEADPSRYADLLVTLERVERSDVVFELTICGGLDGNMEGKITTDGERVMLVVSDVGGPEGEVASLDSRIAHELEHARQFDAGELALACDLSTGHWASHYPSYDVGDEVKAWTAQLALATPGDFWQRREGTWKPTLLKLFAMERTEADRARVLKSHGYARVNPTLDSDVRFDVSSGYHVGQIVRPDLSRGWNVFGRVARIEDACLLGEAKRARRNRA